MAKKKKNKKPGKQKNTLTAKTADIHDLYLKSVQEPTVEVEFFERAFKEHYDRSPLTLREDFCGTAAVCCEWVKSTDDRTAVGIDLDPSPLEWSDKNLQSKLTDDQKSRLEFRLEDVRKQGTPAEIVAAQNFSFFCFHTRADLLEYFKAAYNNVADPGIMVLDMMGGSECYQDETCEDTKKEGFTYVWELDHFDPITSHCIYHIHFKFKDGSRLSNAYTYEWRLWTIPEVRELLLEAGFSKVTVYWEGTDEDGEGDGIFDPAEHGTADPSWICYIVAAK